VIGYENKTKALLHQVVQDPDKAQVLILDRNKSLDHIHAEKNWLEKKLNEHWVANHADVWPSPVFEHKDHDSDVALTEESDTDEAGTDAEEPVVSEEEVVQQVEEDTSSGEDRPLVRGEQVNPKPMIEAQKKKKERAKRKRVISAVSEDDAPDSPIQMEPFDNQEAKDKDKPLYVERFISCNGKTGRRRKFRVRWEGFQPDQDTHETFAQMAKSMGPDKVREFIKAMNGLLTDNDDIEE
jgi:hypothetical protein